MKSERKTGRRHRPPVVALATAALGAAIPAAAGPRLLLPEPAIAGHHYGVAAAWPADRSEPVPAAAKIANSKLLPTVQHRVTKLQPTRQERRFDEVGWVTSATKSTRLAKEIALGFVKRGYNSPGTNLQAASLPVAVVELPFV